MHGSRHDDGSRLVAGFLDPVGSLVSTLWVVGGLWVVGQIFVKNCEF